jgi:galactokinase
MSPERLGAAFAARFGHACQVVAEAPGRVNLIGEHTDYNEGFVLPIATSMRTAVGLAFAAAGCTGSGAEVRVRIYSATLADEQTWRLDEWDPARYPPWTSYIAGVAVESRRRGVPLRSFDGFIKSDLPPGGGLSSSAALTVALAVGLQALGGGQLSLADLAAACRAAEHHFAGVPCGPMDQYAALAARRDHALLLDCRSLACEHVPLALGEHEIVVIDSGVRHELAGSAYGQRRRECAAAVAHFSTHDPSVRALRDVDEQFLRRAWSGLDALSARRARHVVTENGRVLAAAAALRRADLPEFGRLMRAAHESLRDDYEASCAEVDELVAIVGRLPGVLGVRLTGGGFGGCVVALVRSEAVGSIERALREGYNGSERVGQLMRIRAGSHAHVRHV